MAKDPAFLFYPNDWIGGTMGMSLEDKGAYMEVLMMQFNRGHMTEDMIVRMIGQVWVNVKHKFKEDEQGLWFNERLEIEKEKRKTFVQSRHNNKLGTNQHPKKEGHMSNHMENVNGNGKYKYKNGVEQILKPMTGVQFSEDNSGVFFSDGSYQKLGALQLEAVELGNLKPQAVIKGAIY